MFRFANLNFIFQSRRGKTASAERRWSSSNSGPRGGR